MFWEIPLTWKSLSSMTSQHKKHLLLSCLSLQKSSKQGIKVIDLFAPYLKGGKSDSGGAGVGKTCIDPRIDLQHCPRTRWYLSIYWCWGTYSKERPLTGKWKNQALSKTAMVFGQMNEPPEHVCVLLLPNWQSLNTSVMLKAKTFYSLIISSVSHKLVQKYSPFGSYAFSRWLLWPALATEMGQQRTHHQPRKVQ